MEAGKGISDFLNMLLYLRGDSSFASSDIYGDLEDKNCTYALRLKEMQNFAS